MSVVSKLDRMGGRRCEGVQTGWKVQVSARRLCERKNLTELRTGRNSSHATLHTSPWCRSTAGRSRLGTMALARPQRGEGIGSQRALQVGSTGRKRWRPKSEPSCWWWWLPVRTGALRVQARAQPAVRENEECLSPLISFCTNSIIAIVQRDGSIRSPFHGDAGDFFLAESLLMLGQQKKFGLSGRRACKSDKSRTALFKGVLVCSCGQKEFCRADGRFITETFSSPVFEVEGCVIFLRLLSIKKEGTKWQLLLKKRVPGV